jgi:hypothetical protein
MVELRQIEIDRNYDFFQRNLATFLKDHRGEFALLRNAQLVGFYQGPGHAYRAGLDQFDDEIFSVQHVDDEPAHLGLISLAVD